MAPWHTVVTAAADTAHLDIALREENINLQFFTLFIGKKILLYSRGFRPGDPGKMQGFRLPTITLSHPV